MSSVGGALGQFEGSFNTTRLIDPECGRSATTSAAQDAAVKEW
jgi:hypothetical protein